MKVRPMRASRWRSNPAESLSFMLAALFEPFDGGQRLGDVLAEIEVVVDHHDLAGLGDDIGGPGGDPRMRRPGHVISLLGRRSRRRDRERATAFLDRKI